MLVVPFFSDWNAMEYTIIEVRQVAVNKHPKGRAIPKRYSVILDEIIGIYELYTNIRRIIKLCEFRFIVEIHGVIPISYISISSNKIYIRELQYDGAPKHYSGEVNVRTNDHSTQSNRSN